MPITDQMASAIYGGKDDLPPEFGGHNDMPPNWETIKLSEFLWLFGRAGKRMYFRQVLLPSVEHGKHEITEDRKMYCSVYFWVNPDLSGLGFIEHYNGVATRSKEDAFFAQWFKFAYCKHEFETITKRMCYWEGVCKKCGYKEFIDSSD